MIKFVIRMKLIKILEQKGSAFVCQTDWFSFQFRILIWTELIDFRYSPAVILEVFVYFCFCFLSTRRFSPSIPAHTHTFSRHTHGRLSSSFFSFVNFFVRSFVSFKSECPPPFLLCVCNFPSYNLHVHCTYCTQTV